MDPISDDELYETVRGLAERWLEANGDPWADRNDEIDYSTFANPFNHLTEAAFCDALDEYRERHAPRRPPASGVPCVYRLWGNRGRLLYVGVSRNVRARINAHRREWGDLIDAVTYDEHESMEDAIAAEADAIVREHPAINIDHPAPQGVG